MTQPPPALDEREEEVSWVGGGRLAGNGHTAGTHSFSLPPGPLHMTVRLSRLQTVLVNCGLFILTSAQFKAHPGRLIPLQNDKARIEVKLTGKLTGDLFCYLGMSTHKQFVHQDRNTHRVKHMQQQVKRCCKDN